jgi:predicted nucleic acid-binding protein
MAQFYFLDSSAIVKRYISEPGSRWIKELHDDSNIVLCLAYIAPVEVVSSIGRLARMKQISKRHAHEVTGQFRSDLTNDYRIIRLRDKMVDHAMNLSETYGLRAYDSVQLATALSIAPTTLAPLIFVSADIQLNKVAAAERLIVQNPNDHS